MRAGEIQARLTSTNLWWAHPEDWAGRDPDLREASDAPFVHSAGVLDDLTPGGLYVLRGPRRVGKSVELKRTVERLVAGGADPRAIAHMSVDGWVADDLGALVRAADRLMPPEGHRWWLIDEITSITDGWPARIKWLRDNHPRFRGDTVVLTGSSSSNLRDSVGDLAGRRGPASDPDRVMLPIGFRTFVKLVSSHPPAEEAPPLEPLTVADLTPARLRDAAYRLAPWLHMLAEAWEDYLHVGGFPLAVTAHIRSRLPDQSLSLALRAVISGDAFQRARLSDLQTGEMLYRLARGLGSKFSAAGLARDIDVSPPTAQRRIDDLRESFIVWPVHQETGLEPRLRAQEKIYFTDPAYARLAPGGGAGVPDETALSEQQLGMALLRGSLRDGHGSYPAFDRVLHHRSATGAEIDFVGPDFGGVAIESKYVDGRWRRTAGRTLAASPWRGLVATRSELDLDDPQTAAVPAAMLAWLIDT